MLLIPRGDIGPRTDSRIVQQLAPAGIISTVSWLPKSASIGLAGASYRWLRIFDLRSHTTGLHNITSKVQGIAIHPFDEHRIEVSVMVQSLSGISEAGHILC